MPADAGASSMTSMRREQAKRRRPFLARIVPLSSIGGGGSLSMKRLIECFAFPLVVGGALVGFHGFLAVGASPWPAAYAVVAVGYMCIAVHEAYLPERREWRPARGELLTDLLHLALIQVLLPRLLSLAAVLALAHAAAIQDWGLRRLWPHEWSPWAQLVLLTLLAEFPRYWLHRLSHSIDWLWRFHAVHHAPQILYSVNVGRFHPIDKGLQFLVEVLPFIVLGVAPEVLTVYFVFYAVTGFYQHANCRVRLGPLNWIVAGPELHRWHHSLHLAEARSNYGNKLIVWDALFRTRFLPRDRRVSELGVSDATYPTRFLGQMAAPFRRRSAAQA